MGLEVGSKPELLAIMAMVDDDQTPIICNGFKDNAFVELVILASKIGKNIIPVVEKVNELHRIVKYATMHAVKPVLELHPFTGKDYYLGVFLVGAYQEILGDLHNLFGDTNAVHVSVVLKLRLSECDEAFAHYVIAHEFAHAYLRNGPWGGIFNTEDAANALAASWGFPVPDKLPWVGL